MAYEVWLGTMLFPIPPSKIETKIKGQNKTLTLINGEEINILKAQGLSEISFDVLLPNVKYPFAQYEKRFNNAKTYLDHLEKLKNEKKPFWFKVTRTFPDGKALYDTNMKVSLEDYTVKEDRKEGFDIVVSVKLKQYKDFGTKTYNVQTQQKQTPRATDNSPSAKTTTYTVKKGDSLWSIAKYFYGDGNKYTVIYEANKNIVPKSYIVEAGQVLTIPGVDTPVAKNTPPAKSTSTDSRTSTQEETPKTEKVMATIYNHPEQFTSRANGTLHIQYCVDGKVTRKTMRSEQGSYEAKHNTPKGVSVLVDKGTEVYISTRPDNWDDATTKNMGTITITVTDVYWKKTVDKGNGYQTYTKRADEKVTANVYWEFKKRTLIYGH